MRLPHGMRRYDVRRDTLRHGITHNVVARMLRACMHRASLAGDGGKPCALCYRRVRVADVHHGEREASDIAERACTGQYTGARRTIYNATHQLQRAPHLA
jgi:hypothetical protein